MTQQLVSVPHPQVSEAISADEAVGIQVNHLMFVRRMTRKQLGEILGITGPAAGRKLRGEAGWSLDDLYVVSAYFGIEVSDLLPRREMIQAPTMKPGPGVARSEGLEPPTF